MRVMSFPFLMPSGRQPGLESPSNQGRGTKWSVAPEGVWLAIVVDGQIVGSISVERMANEKRSVGSIGYMILTPFWSQGIGTEAVRQICGIAFRELALERIIGEVFPENLASARVLEKNGFRLEETKPGAVVKGGKAMDVKVYGLPR